MGTEPRFGVGKGTELSYVVVLRLGKYGEAAAQSRADFFVGA
jgi:hypothetical protein